MKQLIFSFIILNVALNSFSQNVGVGTTTPSEKLDVKGNLNVQGTIKANGIQGLNGEVLSSTGSGLSWVKGIYTLNSANYLSTNVPVDNYVRIDGDITLESDYSGLNSSRLFIVGGRVLGNGTTVLNLYANTTISGTSFISVDINGFGLTFINCNFSGPCPRLGSGNVFINCQFGTITTASSIGLLDGCNIQSCTLQNVTTIRNSTLANCTIGGTGLNSMSDCTILNSSIYALSDLTAISNKFEYSKIFVGNPTNSPFSLLISNNQFDNVLSGQSEAIEVNPSTTNYKIFTISNNVFSLQSNTPRAIYVNGNDGNALGNSRMSIQYNTFWRSMTTLDYFSNMRINYSYNTVYETGTHPSNSGNLITNSNLTLF